MKTGTELFEELEHWRRHAGTLQSVKHLSDEYDRAHMRALVRIDVLEWVLDKNKNRTLKTKFE